MRVFPLSNYIMDQKLFLLTVVVEAGLVTNTESIVKALRLIMFCYSMENHNDSKIERIEDKVSGEKYRKESRISSTIREKKSFSFSGVAFYGLG